MDRALAEIEGTWGVVRVRVAASERYPHRILRPWLCCWIDLAVPWFERQVTEVSMDRALVPSSQGYDALLAEAGRPPTRVWVLDAETAAAVRACVPSGIEIVVRKSRILRSLAEAVRQETPDEAKAGNGVPGSLLVSDRVQAELFAAASELHDRCAQSGLGKTLCFSVTPRCEDIPFTAAVWSAKTEMLFVLDRVELLDRMHGGQRIDAHHGMLLFLEPDSLGPLPREVRERGWKVPRTTSMLPYLRFVDGNGQSVPLSDADVVRSIVCARAAVTWIDRVSCAAEEPAPIEVQVSAVGRMIHVALAPI